MKEGKGQSAGRVEVTRSKRYGSEVRLEAVALQPLRASHLRRSRSLCAIRKTSEGRGQRKEASRLATDKRTGEEISEVGEARRARWW